MSSMLSRNWRDLMKKKQLQNTKLGTENRPLIAEENGQVETATKICPRKKGSPEKAMDEINAVMRHFKSHIAQGRLASKLDCQHYRFAEDPILNSRSVQNIQDFFTLKVAILNRMGATPEDYRRKFREEVFSAEEHPTAIAHRLKDYAMGSQVSGLGVAAGASCPCRRTRVNKPEKEHQGLE
ncbi:UNVERIFIED_CONTAM: hypothetical protein FKN15_044065 [Acipenser sinensis]